jgi:hypothetical protein
VGTKYGEAADFLVGSYVLVRWYDGTDFPVQVSVFEGAFSSVLLVL